MRPLSGWLERFRRPAGVPAAASDEVDSELMPVFASLDVIEEEALALRAEAEREAARRLDAAAVEAERVVERARRLAEAERARAEAERRQQVTAEVRAIEAGAEAEAERIRSRGLERLPALVDLVVRRVQEDV